MSAGWGDERWMGVSACLAVLFTALCKRFNSAEFEGAIATLPAVMIATTGRSVGRAFRLIDSFGFSVSRP